MMTNGSDRLYTPNGFRYF